MNSPFPISASSYGSLSTRGSGVSVPSYCVAVWQIVSWGTTSSFGCSGSFGGITISYGRACIL